MQVGTKVKMVNCFEATKNPDKVWATRSEPWELGHGEKVVLLDDGFYGTDLTVEINESQIEKPLMILAN